ncbi:hypothetical protein COV16_05245 [Candidatus Woesearchaeota archaeon CG10_big_fil_rev_8_21_14_0_10_34_8]|nr:MAG: hypothetical protein COV16_05245 [Candidatus Woesearchaeota archaeon CG10_big_fil_rev_8_21_14_0_10_34_8]
MIECQVVIKRWGNSFGLVLPKVFMRINKIKPDDRVRIIITKIDKKNAAKQLWGALPQLSSSEELEKWVDKDFDIR